MTDIPWGFHFDDNPPESFDFKSLPIFHYLDYAADHYGKRKAIQFQNLSMNYSQLREKSERMAATLRCMGIESGDRIAIMLPNLPQTIIAFWGALKAGAIVVMTNPLYMEKELTHHFNDSKPKILITLDMFWDKIHNLWDKLDIEKCFVSRVADSVAFPLNVLQPIQARLKKTLPHVPYNGKTILKWKDLFASNTHFSATIKDPDNTLALLQYTGGTTGFSKGAMLSHANISIQIQQLLEICRSGPKEQHSFLGIMPFFHIMGLAGCVVYAAAHAASLLPIPRYVPHEVLDIIKKNRPTFFVGAPSIYISLMQQKQIKNCDMSCIEICVSGSSPFPEASLNRFREITKARISEGLGITETSPVVCANPVHGMQKTGSVGVPLPGTYVRIVDMEDGIADMPTGKEGEILVKGPQVMKGYWNHPEETANSIRDGWFYSGDIGKMDEDGYIFIVDRKKDMAIVGGYNVFPREIDEVLYEYPKIQDAVALSIPHRTKGEILKAYIVAKPGEIITAAEIIAFCREKLASYKIPRLIEFRDELPKSMVGKVLRRALRAEEEQKNVASLAEKELQSKQEKIPAETVLTKNVVIENVAAKSASEKSTSTKNSSAKSTSAEKPKSTATKRQEKVVTESASAKKPKSTATKQKKKDV